jgi:hypothetical protein
VAVDLGNAFHFILPLALCLAGFHGVFFYAAPWKKTASWCAFQLGLAVFLFQLASQDNSFPAALAFLVLATTLGVGIMLRAFCVKLGKRTSTPKRAPK